MSPIITMPPTIAIVVPYCDRRDHLAQTLPILLDYDPDARPWLIVVEQVRSMAGEKKLHPFNRGLLCNLGARIALDEEPETHLVCFHDVDMIPGDGVVYNSEVGSPASLVGSIEDGTEDGKPKAPGYFGGVVVFRRLDLMTVGGFSNQYWGWGNEDIDLRMRVEWAGMPIEYKGHRFIHRDHPPTIVRELLIANHKRLGKTQDRKIKPGDDGLATMPTLEPKSRTDVPGGPPERPTLITHVQYAVDRDEIEKEYNALAAASTADAAAATAATLEGLGISPQ